MSRAAGMRAFRDRLAERLQRFIAFLRTDLWHDPEESGRIRLFFYQALRVLVVTGNGLRNQVILLRASALSYSTLLAIVPLLAIAFSMMKGLGVHSHIEHLLVNYLTAEQEEISNRIIEYISNTDFKALGAVGTGILIIAVLMMLSSVERTFNELWGVNRGRRIARKISDYISVLIFGPLLIVLSTAALASLSSHTIVRSLSRYEVFEQFFVLFHTILPHAGLWLAFTAIYVLMPNTRVRFFPALIAGVVCGSLWEVAFKLYTDFNIGVARYNTIYGTFAVLPIFIVWLYISWIIVLIGAQLSYSIQNFRSYQQELKSNAVSQEQREEMAVFVMARIVEQFQQGGAPMTIGALSGSLSFPVQLVREIIRRLHEEGLVHEVFAEEPCYQPAQSPALISVLDVCRAVRYSSAEENWQISDVSRYPVLQQLLFSVRSAEASELGESSLQELVNTGRPD
ncbi:MAG: YhjD/YihY/BrkB family envelope integrity protein [Desulfosalsimonadaceae bacterium]